MICMLTIYVICIPLVNKAADAVVNAYLKGIYCRLGRSH